MKDAQSHYDAQTLDVATTEQLEEQGQITQDNEQADSDADQDAEMKEEIEDEPVSIWSMWKGSVW